METTGGHCPGCRGYTRDWEGCCPGLLPDGTAARAPLAGVVPRMTFRGRLAVLAGREVRLEHPVPRYRSAGVSFSRAPRGN